MGVRKAMGSLRSQLVQQFYSETVIVVLSAFLLSVLLIQVALPWFNDIADKQITLKVNNSYLWLFSLGIILVTALISGSYSALVSLPLFARVKCLKERIVMVAMPLTA